MFNIWPSPRVRGVQNVLAGKTPVGVGGGQYGGATKARSDLVRHLVGDLDELAVDELAIGLLAVIDVLPHLQHDLVGARSGVGVLVTGLGASGRRRDHLAVTANLPLQPEAPVVGHLAPRDTATLQPDLAARTAFVLLFHGMSPASRVGLSLRASRHALQLREVNHRKVVAASIFFQRRFPNKRTGVYNSRTRALSSRHTRTGDDLCQKPFSRSVSRPPGSRPAAPRTRRSTSTPSPAAISCCASSGRPASPPRSRS